MMEWEKNKGISKNSFRQPCGLPFDSPLDCLTS